MVTHASGPSRRERLNSVLSTDSTDPSCSRKNVSISTLLLTVLTNIKNEETPTGIHLAANRNTTLTTRTAPGFESQTTPQEFTGATSPRSSRVGFYHMDQAQLKGALLTATRICWGIMESPSLSYLFPQHQ